MPLDKCREVLNEFDVTITFTLVQPSIHEVWAELNKLPVVLSRVDIKSIGTLVVEDSG